MLELSDHEDVAPFLRAVRARGRDGVLEEVERSRAEPQKAGRFVIEVEEDGEWRRAGLMGFDVANERNRIANLGGLAIHPEFRGRRLADDAARLFQRHLLLELDFHRLQLEIYGFNERAIHARGALGLHPRGDEAQGVPAPRRVGRRRPVRARARRPGRLAR